MYLKSWVLLSATVLLGACAHLPKQSIQSTKNEVQNQLAQQRDSNLKQSVQNYTHDQSLFDVAFDDLNVDGQDDAIVLLKGQEWCGSGGCTMLIFKGKSNQEFEFLSKTTLVDSPVYSTHAVQNTWKQLSVYSRKHGQVMLKFDGSGYPLNPSLLPLDTTELNLNNSKLLFGLGE
ncbi:hypothetical protein [uncultured Acinetobacter sp.]|uniref:hypothetical protein n=1 Tax=uncultured Acinetobacter sp. TaxID=165433 RepID=UPI0025FFF1A0|nr:hypothetical protein [uncultured Acinetobacter sp.]